MGIRPSVTAITLVALGTSLPDTFASMTAAAAEKYADSAIGNVTGSNSVNVFLGLGLPWAIAATYELKYKGIKVQYPGEKNADGSYKKLEWEASGQYFVPTGALGFSVAVFCVCAICCVIFLLIRRYCLGGELGGKNPARFMSCAFLCTLWLVYIGISIVQAYGGIQGVSFGVTNVAEVPNRKLHDSVMRCRQLFVNERDVPEGDFNPYYWKIKEGTKPYDYTKVWK